MQTKFGKVRFLVGDEDILLGMGGIPALPMFSVQAMTFLEDLSRKLLTDKGVRNFDDVMSYAYWIRKGSLEQTAERHRDRTNRIGRGMAFHVAPSNVPVNFAVSMTSSLLAGNATVVRVSSRQFEQVNIISSAINNLLEYGHEEMKPYICLLRYEHDEQITADLSSLCDIRIIWGGNRTIREIRNAEIPPRAIEMAFADRHSIALIEAGAYLSSDPEAVAKGFYTDTYYTDQNACSSPRIVVWFGKSHEIKEARERFWNKLIGLVHRDYDMKPIQAIDKYSAFCDLAMDSDAVKLISTDNRLVRVEADRLSSELMDYKMGGGYFFEYIAQDLGDIVPLLGKQCQTVSVLGIGKDQVKKLVFETGVRGVDRIVPLGQTMGLEFIWDGYKMVENMTRFVYTGDYE